MDRISLLNGGGIIFYKVLDASGVDSASSVAIRGQKVQVTPISCRSHLFGSASACMLLLVSGILDGDRC